MRSTAERAVAAGGPGAGGGAPSVMEIIRSRKETRDVFTFALRPVDARRELAFAPGQFNMLYVHGVGEVPVSISGDPEEGESLIHTVRSVGMVTKAMGGMKKGDQLGVRGPFGTGWPAGPASGKDLVIVAGGIGLAPLRPWLYHVLNHRDRYGKVTLLYGTRTPDDILYERELERWRSRFDLDVHITVDRATIGWRGNVGVVTTLIAKAPFDPSNTVATICGPEVMMRFTVQEFTRKGLAPDRIYLSMERNMKCGVGLCGHCQLGPAFICKDGPVFRYDAVSRLVSVREL